MVRSVGGGVGFEGCRSADRVHSTSRRPETNTIVVLLVLCTAKVTQQQLQHRGAARKGGRHQSLPPFRSRTNTPSRAVRFKPTIRQRWQLRTVDRGLCRAATDLLLAPAAAPWRQGLAPTALLAHRDVADKLSHTFMHLRLAQWFARDLNTLVDHSCNHQRSSSLENYHSQGTGGLLVSLLSMWAC